MTIQPLTVVDNHPDTIKIIANTLTEDGLVLLRLPRLKNWLAATKRELAPHFARYPNCEGYFYGHSTRRFGGVFAKSSASHKLATDPTVVAVMNAVLGPLCDRIQINLTQAIRILPGEKEQLPHRDDEAFPFPHEGSTFMINAMWALTDFTRENGGTRLWPGSHKDTLTREPDYDDAYFADMQAGDVLLYVGGLLHHGGANTTPTARDGLVISYSLAWLRQAENQFLTYPPEVARTFPRVLQDLIGYQAHRPNLGWVDGTDPGFLLRDSDADAAHASRDLLPPDVETLVKELVEARDNPMREAS